MVKIERTIEKAIEMTQADILKNKDKFLTLLEDLSPDLVAEREQLRKIYSDELGKILYEVYCSEKNGIGGNWAGVKSHLNDVLELKETRQNTVISCFKAAFRNEMQSILDEAQREEVNGDIMKAIYLYEKIEDGSPYERTAQKRLGKIYESFPEKSFKYYLRAAELGDAEASFNVGYMYEYGEGVAESLPQAKNYYTIAAKAGHRGALHNLGIF